MNGSRSLGIFFRNIRRDDHAVCAAFTFVAGRAWAPLFAIIGFTLVVANFGSGMGAQLGAARLLYGMGRSGALPACLGSTSKIQTGKLERVPPSTIVAILPFASSNSTGSKK